MSQFVVQACPKMLLFLMCGAVGCSLLQVQAEIFTILISEYQNVDTKYIKTKQKIDNDNCSAYILGERQEQL